MWNTQMRPIWFNNFVICWSHLRTEDKKRLNPRRAYYIKHTSRSVPKITKEWYDAWLEVLKKNRRKLRGKAAVWENRGSDTWWFGRRYVYFEHRVLDGAGYGFFGGG
jgi:hypothetical protein